MSNKKNRNKKEMIDDKGLTIYAKDRRNHSTRMAYPGKFKKVKRDLGFTWIPKKIKGSLSGKAKELNIVGLKS